MAKTTARIQIRQIAERVGLSQSTVSIVLNGRGDEMRISKESQRRIREAAKEMNYQPNIYARRLRRAGAEKQAGQIVCVFWNETSAEDAMIQYFKGLSRAVEKNGYGVEFMVKLFKTGRLSELRDSMTLLKYNGILIVGASQTDLDYLAQEDLDIPIVVNRPSDKYTSVYMDAYEVGAECARMFSKKGFRTAGMMSAQLPTVGMGLRELGFLNGCRSLGIDVREEWVMRGENTDMQTGYEYASRFCAMEERPAGVFIMQESLTLGAMMYFKGSKVRIPEDLALVSFGLTPILKHMTPSVTMIGVSMADTGETAIDILMTVIKNNIKMPISKLLPFKCEYGDSFRPDGGGEAAWPVQGKE